MWVVMLEFSTTDVLRDPTACLPVSLSAGSKQATPKRPVDLSKVQKVVMVPGKRQIHGTPTRTVSYRGPRIEK